MKTVNLEEVEGEDKIVNNKQEGGEIKSRRTLGKEEKKDLEEFLAICERFNISDTAASHLFNLENEKKNIDTKINQSQVNKFKRKFRIKKVQEFEYGDVIALGFDERIDKTKTVVGVGLKGCKRFEMHYIALPFTSVNISYNQL